MSPAQDVLTPGVHVLIAEDDQATTLMLSSLLWSWGQRVTAVADGHAAVAALVGPEPPEIALLDWEMPGLSGPEVCRVIRATPLDLRPHLILVTGRSLVSDVVAGLDAGADDYLSKPFDPDELRARLNAAIRIVELQRRVALHVRELKASLEKMQGLRGSLPICAYCKSIRDGADDWHRVEAYLSQHADVQFSHGICPACMAMAMEQAEEHDA
jgi:DNA-binding response OmpR family regulator